MPIVVGGVFAAIFLVLLVAFLVNRGATSGQTINGIHCDTGEQLATHYHAHLDIIYKGQPANLAANTGILSDCLYWTHTHDTSGIIHIEAPKQQASRQFTLGDFFAIWHQPLSKTQVATFQVKPGDVLKVWVNGEPYTDDPSKIVLKSHAQIVIEIAPPLTEPPPTFTWDPSQYPQ
jgi:hypothetical protein